MISYTEKIKLSAKSIANIKEGNLDSKKLEAILSDSKVLYTLILDYEYGKGNLQNVELVDDSLIFTSAYGGILKVSYDINEFSVCSALDYTGEYKMLLNFQIDVQTGGISLTGEERYE
ncbi:hypothetical protein [Pedobacter sp. JCM 36344]|uniref:hypothetical protein n=1 Tax=Pedobacter sp. JCM 36344 TaxID=3374280 RepID=UPI00397AC405